MVSFTFEATVITANNTKKLPKLEAIASVTLVTNPNVNIPENSEDPIINRAAPRLAPELMPNTKGPAKGLRKRVCISKPLKASPLPTSRAVKALGIR